MLDENDVVEAVCNYLVDSGYQIIQKLDTTQKGDDIIAKKNNVNIHIEAKGATSSNKSSKKYGKPFIGSQIHIRTSKAIFKAMEMKYDDSSKEKKVGIALPRNSKYESEIRKIKPGLLALNISLFWVNEDGKVEVEL